LSFSKTFTIYNKKKIIDIKLFLKLAELECKECGKIFEYEKESSCRGQLKRHLRECHHMSVLDYIVKHEYNGIRPKCPCGCGHELNLRSGGKRWEFTKYYADTCYGNLVRSCNEDVLKHYKEAHKNDFDVVKYYETHYDRDTYEKAFKLFSSKEFTLEDVSKSYNIDKRTLKKVWLAMNITNAAELTELIDYSKYTLSKLHNPKVIINDETMMSWMYNMIKTHPSKYTIHALIKEYNKTHLENPCESYDGTLLQSLHRIYGDEIDFLLATGYHSSEEYKLYEVLKFFIPEYRIKLGKRFILNGDYCYFDFLIGSKLLIEYDSDGKFHESKSVKINDKEKENFAKENGYSFLRLSKKEAQDINTIIKIKNMLKNETS